MELAQDIYYKFDPELEATRFLSEIQNLSYADRRRLGWQRIHPKLKRFTYRYVAFDTTNPISIDRARDLITRSRLWLSSPADFNDPFDCKAFVVSEHSAQVKRQKLERMIRVFKPALNRHQRKTEIDSLISRSQSEWATIAESAISEEIAKVGVTCFSDDPHNLLMWSHYSREHTGICFQFEVLRDAEVFARTLEVLYTKTYPTINFFTFDNTKDVMRMVLAKFEDWQYESERRIVAPKGAHKWLRFNPEALSGIILGARISARSEEALRVLLHERQHAGLPPLKLYSAEQHTSAYMLKIYKKAPPFNQ